MVQGRHNNWKAYPTYRKSYQFSYQLANCYYRYASVYAPAGFITEVMGQSTQQGMITFDQALHHADSANELRLMIKLDEKADLTIPDKDSPLEGATILNLE